MNISPINYNKYNGNKNTITNIKQNTDITFKGKEAGKITEFFAKTYGKYILNSEQVHKFCETCSKIDKKDASRHFQVIGSAVTSFAYMNSTMKSKDIEKKDARTLATNQFLGFIIPSGAAYGANASMTKFNKCLEKKRFSTDFTHREPLVFHSLFYIYNYIKSKFCTIQGRACGQEFQRSGCWHSYGLQCFI